MPNQEIKINKSKIKRLKAIDKNPYSDIESKINSQPHKKNLSMDGNVVLETENSAEFYGNQEFGSDRVKDDINEDLKKLDANLAFLNDLN